MIETKPETKTKTQSTSRIRFRKWMTLGFGMKTWLLFLLLAAAAFAKGGSGVRQQRQYPPHLEDATVEKYKTVGDVSLNLWIFNPQDHKPSDHRAAILFFFGGGWNSGSPEQFQSQCRHLAERGMVAMAVDYRVNSRHGVKPVQCVADAKSAMRWVRANAVRLGIDPQRIAAGGGSAGGHLAACTALIKDCDEPGENTAVSAVPNALVLFNPALMLAPLEGYKFAVSGARGTGEQFVFRMVLAC
jgi:acetyl esterase/lipase